MKCNVGNYHIHQHIDGKNKTEQWTDCQIFIFNYDSCNRSADCGINDGKRHHD